MKFLSVATMAVLAAIADARLAFTNSDFEITAGEPFTLTWDGASAPVTITLMNGPSGDLQPVKVIDTNDGANSFIWTPPTDLASDTYAFEIDDGVGPPNYSKPFPFQGTGSATTSLPSETTASPSSTNSPSVSTAISASASNTTASHSASTSGTASNTASNTASETSEPTSVPNTNDGLTHKSPLALVLVTVAALLYLN